MSQSLQGLSAQAREAKSWPFEQARILLARILRLRLTDAERDLAASLIAEGKAAQAAATFEALNKPVVFQCGFGASGLPHMGTFGEAARPTIVRNAFRALTEDAIPTQLIVFSDDMDGLRKIPDNVPNHAMLEEDRDKPVTSVRDPFGEYESFGAHNNARLRDFLDGFGFDYTFMSSTETYRSGRFDEVLLKILARFDAVQGVMLPTLGEERRATYSPFLPISPTTGRVLQAPTLERHVEKGTIVFPDEDGTPTEVPVTGGHVKLQWRPDWAARWVALGVDFEASGKDLVDSVRVSSRLARILGGEPPEAFHFELFMDENNQKISKSKGNGLTMEQWLRYGTPESLTYYMFQSPKSAKRLYFDVIPRATDEYIQHLDALLRRKAEGANEPQIDNPAWHVHGGGPPERGSPVSFSLLLNLVSAADASTKEMLWAFLARYLPGATPESEPLLDKLAGYAINYYEDFVRPNKRYRAPDARERVAMRALADRLRVLPQDADADVIQNEVFEVGKAAGFEPLRLWFSALYEVLLGQSQGPRFGSFVAIFGPDRTVELFERALSGGLIPATSTAPSRFMFEIYRDKAQEYRVRLRRDGHVLFSTEGYASKAAATACMDAIRTYGAQAAVKSDLDPQATISADSDVSTGRSAYKFEIYKDRAGNFRVRFKYNSEVIFSTEGYSSKSMALNAIESMKINGPPAPTDDLDDDSYFFEIYKDKAGEFRVRFKRRGEVIFSTEAYADLALAKDAIDEIRTLGAGVAAIDMTG